MSDYLLDVVELSHGDDRRVCANILGELVEHSQFVALLELAGLILNGSGQFRQVFFDLLNWIGVLLWRLLQHVGEKRVSGIELLFAGSEVFDRPLAFNGLEPLGFFD